MPEEYSEKTIIEKIEIQDKKLEAILRSTERTRKYFLWTLIITAVFFVLPLVGLVVAIPQIISIYSSAAGF